MMMASFKMFLRQIYSDAMLVLSAIAPVLAGAVFRFGVPRLELFLSSRIGSPAIAPYYLLIDLFLALLGPYMLCFASAMVILEERDCGLGLYFSVTPVGRSGYFVSRLAFPSLIAGCASFGLVSIFGLSNMAIPARLLAASGSAVVSVIVSLLVVAVSRNRIEGMATAKMCGLVLAGVAVPFVSASSRRYIASFLPSFWLGESALRFSWPAILAFAAVSLLWLVPLLLAMRKRLAGDC